jgi:hypothetical protein
LAGTLPGEECGAVDAWGTACETSESSGNLLGMGKGDELSGKNAMAAFD